MAFATQVCHFWRERTRRGRAVATDDEVPLSRRSMLAGTAGILGAAGAHALATPSAAWSTSGPSDQQLGESGPSDQHLGKEVPLRRNAAPNALFPQAIHLPHELRTRTADNRDLVYLTGTAIVSFEGVPNDWRRDELWIPVGPAWTRVDAVAPIASLASIGTTDPNVVTGWATDGTFWSIFDGRILIRVQLAVAVQNVWLGRVAYHVTAIGQL